MFEVDKFVLRHGGCEIRSEDIAYIRHFPANFPNLSRTEAILTLSEHPGWTTLAGAPRRDAALSLLEQLDQVGEIRLPPRKSSDRVSCAKKGRSQNKHEVLTAPEPQG